MSASSSSSATTSPLSVFFDETPDDAAAVQNLQQALSSISVTSAAALSELGKDSSGTLCQQLAEAAAHPELHLLKGNKQASALVIIKYQRILRSAITRATSTVSVTGGVDAARLATLSQSYWGGIPSPALSPSPRLLRRLKDDVGSYVDLYFTPHHTTTSRDQDRRPRTFPELLLTTLPWLFCLQTLSESRCGTGVLEYPLFPAKVASQLNADAAIAYDRRYREGLAQKARAMSSVTAKSYSECLLTCLASPNDPGLTAEIYTNSTGPSANLRRPAVDSDRSERDRRNMRQRIPQPPPPQQ